MFFLCTFMHPLHKSGNKHLAKLSDWKWKNINTRLPTNYLTLYKECLMLKHLKGSGHVENLKLAQLKHLQTA